MKGFFNIYLYYHKYFSIYSPSVILRMSYSSNIEVFPRLKKKFKITVFKAFSIMVQGDPGRHHYPWKMYKLKNKH